MKFLRHAQFFAVFAAAAASAQTPETPPAGVGLDCWVGNDGRPFYTNYIRCIADRDMPHPVLADAEAEALLDQLHRQLHEDSGAAAERLFQGKLELVRETSSVWSIRIHAYPYEGSWREGRPEQLVRAVLCPKDRPCTVTIRPR